MTVSELIARLSCEPGDRIVAVMREDFPHDIRELETETCTGGKFQRINGYHYVCYYPEAEEEPTYPVLVIR